jgi:hypothetical protein
MRLGLRPTSTAKPSPSPATWNDYGSAGRHGDLTNPPERSSRNIPGSVARSVVPVAAIKGHHTRDVPRIRRKTPSGMICRQTGPPASHRGNPIFAERHPNGSPEPTAEESDEAGFVSVWDLIQQARDLARWAEQYRADRRRWPRVLRRRAG